VPEVFQMSDDGLAYVKEGGQIFKDPGGEEQKASVPSELEQAVRDMVEECPAECIYIDEG
jgi:ferredoxin